MTGLEATLPAVTLDFLGAAGTVTGSKFLVSGRDARVLVDCGMFQGERQWRRRNWERPPFAVDELDAIVVTHAHLDHCGYLPVVVRSGYAGPIYCTPNTARLIEIVLRDAAHLQEEDAEHARMSGYSKHEPPMPLFGAVDAEHTIALLRPASNASTQITKDASVTLRSAGHILGSAFAELTIDDRRLLFSGDLGRRNHPLLRPPAAPGPADAVVVESTYGNRRHAEDSAGLLIAAIHRTAARGGSALIPAFAVDRTPMLLHHLRNLTVTGRIPRLPIYVDSPMALAALDVYRDAIADADREIRPDVLADTDPFDAGNVTFCPTREESERLNTPRYPSIIVSASGMATGGRVLHHLRHQLPDRRNGVILTGFQVAGTRGRALADGERQIKIHGHYVPVHAEVTNIRGFSAHADCDETIAWLSAIPRPDATYVVHGESTAAATVAHRLTDELGWNAVPPLYRERVLVGRNPRCEDLGPDAE